MVWLFGALLMPSPQLFILDTKPRAFVLLRIGRDPTNSPQPISLHMITQNPAYHHSTREIWRRSCNHNDDLDTSPAPPKKSGLACWKTRWLFYWWCMHSRSRGSLHGTFIDAKAKEEVSLICCESVEINAQNHLCMCICNGRYPSHHLWPVRPQSL